MKYPIPKWLAEGHDSPRPARVGRSVAEKDLDNLLRATKAKAYLECVHDLQMGFKKHRINSFALTSIAPVMRTVMLKAEVFMSEVD